MKKTPKKVLGILGLFAVGSMTVFAATLPVPGAAAINTVTDTISVRVLSGTPWVRIDSPQSDTSLSHPEIDIKYSYENVDRVQTILEYYDDEGQLQSIVLQDIPTEEVGEGTLDFNLSDYGLSYNDYTIKMIGSGLDGVQYEDAITLKYIPVITTIEQDPVTQDIYANLDYDLSNPEIDKIRLDIYDEAGNVVSSISPIEVPRGTTKIELPFYENNLPEGKYRVVTTALNAAGEILYEPYTVWLNYAPQVNPGDVPNTGGLTTGALNISQTDYLVTGLIILSVTGFAGIYYIARNKKTNKNTRK